MVAYRAALLYPAIPHGTVRHKAATVQPPSQLPFALLYSHDLPINRRRPPGPDEYAQHSAAMNLPVDSIELTLCLVAPQCQSSMDYLRWMDSMPSSQRAGCVPIMVQHPTTSADTFGQQAFQMYDISMRILGRPHCFKYAAGPMPLLPDGSARRSAAQ